MKRSTPHPSDKQSRLPFLYFTIAISIMHICNVMAFKVITIFGFQMAFTGVFFPFSFLLLSIINETYGHVETERFILYILLGQTILIACISLAIRIDIHNGVETSGLYHQLFNNLYRLLLSSNVAVGLSYYFTSLLNSKLKCWYLGKSWWLRFLTANGSGKAILVLSTYPINFFGTLSFSAIAHICLNTWIFKMGFAILLIPLARPLITISKKQDQTDIYDFNINYSPLSMYRLGNQGHNYFAKDLKKGDH